MPKHLITSSRVLWNPQTRSAYPNIASALQRLCEKGNLVTMVSNRKVPSWLSAIYPFIRFQQSQARQNGQIVGELLNADSRFGPADAVILGASEEDLFMAANSRSLLIQCSWAELDYRVREYGIPCKSPDQLVSYVQFLETASPWYFESSESSPQIYVLTNAGTYAEPDRQMVRLVERLQSCLKDGELTHRVGFQLHLLSSVLRTNILRNAHFWGYYPSSRSDNTGQETMESFCKQIRHAMKIREYGPMIIRHRFGLTRHKVRGAERDDPSNELKTVHLNPKYKTRIQGKTVVITDDYLTRGVSFSVAHALLREAGAEQVVCLAMGQFGSAARFHTITIQSDPFKPIANFTLGPSSVFQGHYQQQAQLDFLRKFKQAHENSN